MTLFLQFRYYPCKAGNLFHFFPHLSVKIYEADICDNSLQLFHFITVRIFSSYYLFPFIHFLLQSCKYSCSILYCLPKNMTFVQTLEKSYRLTCCRLCFSDLREFNSVVQLLICDFAFFQLCPFLTSNKIKLFRLCR